jgi:hypothetical protein
LKLLQEIAGNTLEAISIGKDFLSRTLMAQQLRERTNKLDYVKLKTFCTTIRMVSKLKKPPTEWDKIFGSYPSNKGLITKLYSVFRTTKLLPKNQ